MLFTEFDPMTTETVHAAQLGGGYMFMGRFLGPVDDPVTMRKNQWLREAYEEYGRTFYQK